VVYASLFGLMAVGLTLTYLTTKVPNFAYGSFVTIGGYTSFSVFRINHVNPYFAVPLAFLLGAVVSVAMYLGVLRTLARRGSSLVALMISTLAIDIAFVGIFGIYSDYIGSFSVLWLQGGTTFGSGLIVEIFAASVLGGLASVYGAALGGLIIGATEILLTQAGIAVFGSWISIYQKGFPLLIMVITLLLFPRGLVSINWHRIIRPIAVFVGLIGNRLGEIFRFVRGE